MRETVPTRHAAKALLYTPCDRILLTMGDRPLGQGGRWNLLGGGIDPGESSRKALDRELEEELGPQFPVADLRMRLDGVIDGEVVDRNGNHLRANWDVYTGPLPDSSINNLDFRRVALMDPYEVMRLIASQHVSELAVRAILDYGLPRLGTR